MSITRLRSFYFIFLFIFLFFPFASQANTLTRAPSNLGLVGYWPMNEGAGTIASDFSGNKSDTGLYGTMAWGVGKMSKGLQAGDVNGYAFATMNNPIPINGAQTINIWYNLRNIPGTSVVLLTVKNVANTAGHHFVIHSTGNMSIGRWGGGNIIDPVTSNNPFGSWGMMTFTYDGVSTYKLYSNGVEVASSGSGLLSGNIEEFQFSGYSASLDQKLTSGDTLDEARIYNRALSASEILSLYNTKLVSRKTVSNQGLIGYWPMEEGSGTGLGDFSGNKNDGTLTNMASPATAISGWGNGKFGKGLNFDGTNDYVVRSVNGTTLTQLTVSFWVRPSGTVSGQRGIFQWANSLSSGDPFILVARESNTENLRFYVDGNYQINTPVSNNVWVFITLKLDTNNLWTFYVNGQSVGSYQDDAAHANKNFASSVYFGNGYDGYFYGSIDDARIYSRALSGDEIYSLYKSNQTAGAKAQTSLVSNGLVGYWPFGGNDINWGTGQVFDASGNGNTGNMINMSTSSSPVIGKVGQGLNFDGSNDYLEFTPSTSLFNGDYTLSMWLYPRNTSKENYILGADYNNNPSVLFYIFSDGKFRFDERGAGTNFVIDGTNPLSVNKWQHVVVTRSGTTVYSYIDGVLDDTGTSLGLNMNTNKHQLGYALPRNKAGTYYDGLIDEVRFYNRTLSSSEILQLYRAGQ